MDSISNKNINNYCDYTQFENKKSQKLYGVSVLQN
jgi:hypothetical protein